MNNREAVVTKQDQMYSVESYQTQENISGMLNKLK